MFDVRNAANSANAANLLRMAFCVVAIALSATVARAQHTHSGSSGGHSRSASASRSTSRADARDLSPSRVTSAGASIRVDDVRITGNKTVPAAKALSYLKTRRGRAFDPEVIQGDVRALVSSGLFSDVRTYTQQVPDGMIVTFEVFERPTVQYVRFVGNRKIRDKVLSKQTDIEKDDALNQFAVEEARRKIEEFYHSRGYGKATVTILEGNHPKDSGVAFLINEGTVEKILYTRFVGNTVASDARLRTQIASKPGILWLYKGNVDRQQVDADLEVLTAYYRGLGYFRARVGRELNFTNSGKWAIITYVIDEGPRYVIRNVSFVGNKRFSEEQLWNVLELKPGQKFNLAKLRRDEKTLRDLYGQHGHIFADIEADPRFLEEPGQLDLVYDISEDEQYRVGRIDVEIGGDNPHTRRSVVLNRLSLLPGDIVDSTQVRASERRLKASQLFVNNPAEGVTPEIVMRPAAVKSAGSVADQPKQPASDSTYRGQSPEANGAVRWTAEPAPANQPIPGSNDHYRRPMAISGQPGYANPTVQPGTGTRTAQNPPAAGPYGPATGSYGPATGSYGPAAGSYGPATGSYGPATTGVAATGPLAPGPGIASGAPYGPPSPYYSPESSGVLPPPVVDYRMEDIPAGPFADIIARLEETQTGRFMFGVGVNSDAGLTGQIVIDERNFDWRRLPTSWDSILNGTAFRGAGQGFRIEALPGTQVQRYSMNFTEPYLFNTRVSLNVSGFIYDRYYDDWSEQRLGGRIGLGYRITPDLSIQFSTRLERIGMRDPRVLGVPELDEVLGDSDLYSGRLRLIYDTRDVPFAPTEGHLFDFGIEQVFGTYNYPRASIDARKYFLLRERPDSSGRHTLGYSMRLGFTGPRTPLYENYFAGGFSTIRGFDFRGASPQRSGVDVGGEFMMLGSVEYTFPITADDMLKGVVFVDYGTVEEKIEINSDDYRVAVGAGLRIQIPAMGPAPIALDLAFPLAYEDTDDRQIFSFFIGFGR